MNLSNLLKYLPFVLSVAAYLFGVGDASAFTDLSSFQKLLTDNFPQLAGVSLLIGAPLYYLLKQAHDHINSGTLAKAMEDGRLDVGDVIGAVAGSFGTDLATGVKSAMADGAWVTLFHACDFDPDLTQKLADAHTAFRLKRVGK